MELMAPRQDGSVAAESSKPKPDDHRSRSVPDGEGTDALLEHIALALADRIDQPS
jgi:hypothetical protein